MAAGRLIQIKKQQTAPELFIQTTQSRDAMAKCIWMSTQLEPYDVHVRRLPSLLGQGP